MSSQTCQVISYPCSRFVRVEKSASRLPMPIPHRDWYHQRYANAYTLQKRQQAIAAKAAHFEELNEHRQARRAANRDNAEAIFAEHRISYEIRGHTWLCTIGPQQIYYWPKSSRWRVKGKSETWGSRGAQDFLDKVWLWQRINLPKQ